MICLKRRSIPRQADIGKRPFILYITLLLTAVLGQQPVDPLGRSQQIAQGRVMIEVVDNKGNILAHIHINIVWSLKKIRGLIHQVRGQNPVNDSLIVILVKLCKSSCKQDLQSLTSITIRETLTGF